MDAVTFQTEALKLEKLLYHISWSMLNNNEDCADAVQEALAKAWQRRDTLKSMRAFRPWLTRILYKRLCRHSPQPQTPVAGTAGRKRHSQPTAGGSE